MSDPNTAGSGTEGDYRALLGKIPGIEPVKYVETFGSPELRINAPGFLVVGRIVPGRGGDVDTIRVSPLNVSLREPIRHPDGSASVKARLLGHTHHVLRYCGPSITDEELESQLALSPHCGQFGLQGNTVTWRLSDGGHWAEPVPAGVWPVRSGMAAELWQDDPNAEQSVHVVTRLTPEVEGPEGLASIMGMMFEAMGGRPSDIQQILRMISGLS